MKFSLKILYVLLQEEKKQAAVSGIAALSSLLMACAVIFFLPLSSQITPMALVVTVPVTLLWGYNWWTGWGRCRRLRAEIDGQSQVDTSDG